MNDIAEAAGILPGSLYHHFSSKEEIAVELVSAFNEDLIELVAQTQTTTEVGTPERRLRDLAARSAALSMRHAAAIRIRAYQAPTSATERLAAVIDFQMPELIGSWRSVVEATTAPADPPVDSDLLRYALAHLAFDCGTTYPPGTDVRPVSDQACDLLLHGLATTAPADEELDASTPMRVATENVASWSSPPPDDTDTRGQILAAARTEFARRGYAATTIRDIAEVAQVRMGTLYRRISSKEAMLSEVLEAYSQVLTNGVEAVVEADGTDIEKLDAVAYLLLHATRRFHEEVEIVKFGWNGHESSGPFHAYFQQTHQRLGLVEAAVARGIESGAFRPIGTPPEVALLIRRVLWLRYQDFEQASVKRAHSFIRRSVLRPTLP